MRLQIGICRKLQFLGPNRSEIKLDEWFTLKVWLKYSNENNGTIEVWTDGTLMISEMNITLPTANFIQNVLEIGISDSSESKLMCLDNFRVSETEL
ncbi:MAG: hypothetical protein AAGC47_09035 [Bacteroidota bacterium]